MSHHNHNNQQQPDLWTTVKKWAAIVTAILLWLASMQFSYAGFNVNAPDAAWLGWILALSITVIELVFNTDIRKLNLTLFACGILAYLYGIWTNVIGFYFSVQGGTWEMLKSNPLSILFAIVLGLFIEIVPEPLFVWGLGKMEGDMIGNLIKGQRRVDEWTQEDNQNTKFTKSVPDIIKSMNKMQTQYSPDKFQPTRR